jgi:hypothetical protein
MDAITMGNRDVDPCLTHQVEAHAHRGVQVHEIVGGTQIQQC